MLKAEQLRDAPMSVQVEFWNRWNADLHANAFDPPPAPPT
jgi:hypothetical protein